MLIVTGESNIHRDWDNKEIQLISKYIKSENLLFENICY